LGERIRVDAYFEIFTENGDILTKVEAAAEFGYGCVAFS